MNDMINNKNNEEIWLSQAFKHIPEERLPDNFRNIVMDKVMRESVKIKKRNELHYLIATITASLCMISIAILSFIYMDINWIKTPETSSRSWFFYPYIGLIALVLLFLDYKMRQLISKRREEIEHKRC